MGNIKKKQPIYSLGEVFINPYLGNKTTEVLDKNQKRAGWLWTHTDGKIVVSPYLGFYIWYSEEGGEWSAEEGAIWLVKNRR